MGMCNKELILPKEIFSLHAHILGVNLEEECHGLSVIYEEGFGPHGIFSTPKGDGD